MEKALVEVERGVPFITSSRCRYEDGYSDVILLLSTLSFSLVHFQRVEIPFKRNSRTVYIESCRLCCFGVFSTKDVTGPVKSLAAFALGTGRCLCTSDRHIGVLAAVQESDEVKANTV